MAGLKEIRRRIGSVKNTKQITRAMKLVSAAKLKRAQDAAVGARAFSDRLSRLVAELTQGLPQGFTHPLIEAREQVKVRRAVVVSGERGLCGAYNTNVLKAVQADLGKDDVVTEFVAVGRRTVSSAKRFKWNVTQELEGLPEDVSKWPIEELSASLISDFLEGRCDEVVVYYTRFISAITQVVEREVVLPIRAEDLLGAPQEGISRQVKYDPDPESIFSELLPLLIQNKLRKAGFESKASEHAARMTAMDAATNNASDLIERLRLFYNRARQSSITRELIDIVGGSEALK